MPHGLWPRQAALRLRSGRELDLAFLGRSVDAYRADLRAKQTQNSVEMLLGRHYEVTVINSIPTAPKLQAVYLVEKSHPR